MKTVITSKQRELIDRETGELITNFWKCYLMDFLSILGIIDNKQVDIFIYIVENTNQSNNVFLGTYKKISEDVGCSSATIARIMKKLQENNFIKKLQNGAWLVNPNILVRGDDTKRQILLSYYQTEAPINQITMSRTKRKPIPLVQSKKEIEEIPEGQTDVYDFIEE